MNTMQEEYLADMIEYFGAPERNEVIITNYSPELYSEHKFSQNVSNYLEYLTENIEAVLFETAGYVKPKALVNLSGNLDTDNTLYLNGPFTIMIHKVAQEAYEKKMEYGSPGPNGLNLSIEDIRFYLRKNLAVFEENYNLMGDMAAWKEINSRNATKIHYKEISITPKEFHEFFEQACEIFNKKRSAWGAGQPIPRNGSKQDLLEIFSAIEENHKGETTAQKAVKSVIVGYCLKDYIKGRDAQTMLKIIDEITPALTQKIMANTTELITLTPNFIANFLTLREEYNEEWALAMI